MSTGSFGLNGEGVLNFGKSVCEDGVELHYWTAGEGPLVVLVHGFPDLGMGWHHQIKALAETGFRVVAPDMRGYGRTGGPQEASSYSIFTLVGDLVALVEATGEEKAVIIGHDWGSAVAWHAALMRPDMFHAVMGMAVPFQPRRRNGPPTKVMQYLAETQGQDPLYLAAFADKDAHCPMDADPETALRKMFWSFDGATPKDKQATGRIPAGEDFISVIDDGAVLPGWMTQSHFDEYVAAFRKNGFDRPVHWYRQIDENWLRTRWLQGCKVGVPSAFLVGEHDPVRSYAGHFETELENWLTDLRAVTVVAGAGHWVNQENPEAVNQAILSFLWELSLKA